jgi:hypothetical protein
LPEKIAPPGSRPYRREAPLKTRQSSGAYAIREIRRIVCCAGAFIKIIDLDLAKAITEPSCQTAISTAPA